MKRSAQVIGTVQFREGDGPMMVIRPGAVEVEVDRSDVTISWVEGETHGVAAIPLADYKRYVDSGQLVVGDEKAP
jgi:hypothetical protein